MFTFCGFWIQHFLEAQRDLKLSEADLQLPCFSRLYMPSAGIKQINHHAGFLWGFFTGLYYIAQATKHIGLLPPLPVYIGINVCQVCPFLQQDLIHTT